MTVKTKKPTEERVWMKYYSQDVWDYELPKMKAFDYMLKCNESRMDEPALHYYGANISFRDLRRKVDSCAKSFAALGVKKGDIVSFLSAGLPEGRGFYTF